MSSLGHCNKLLKICMCRFSGPRSNHSDSEGEESDGVELEKSNVLLMGPTGSGLSKTSCVCFWQKRMGYVLIS